MIQICQYSILNLYIPHQKILSKIDDDDVDAMEIRQKL